MSGLLFFIRVLNKDSLADIGKFFVSWKLSIELSLNRLVELLEDDT